MCRGEGKHDNELRKHSLDKGIKRNYPRLKYVIFLHEVYEWKVFVLILGFFYWIGYF